MKDKRKETYKPIITETGNIQSPYIVLISCENGSNSPTYFKTRNDAEKYITNYMNTKEK